MGLEDRVVAITGASRGIGRAIALRLARERPRHVVVGYCTNHEAARRTVGEIEALGVAASPLSTDVGQEEELRAFFAEIRKRCGRLDVFVANAARTAFAPTLELSMRSWRRTLELNVDAFLLGAQLAARLMEEGGTGGHIVGLSSLGARAYVPSYAALGTAKAAIEALTRYLAVELAPRGINVNVVCAGFIDTDSTRMLPSFDAAVAETAARTPAGRIGRPEDLAGVVAFLCSPEAAWIRGQTVVADGGYSLIS
jgi:enoyl-[acyl-carrier protein] reductase III